MNLSRVILLLVIFNTLVVIGGSAFTYMTLRSVQAGEQLPVLPGTSAKSEEKVSEYRFFPIEKIIVSLTGKNREHYFVIDLVLQADINADPKKIEQLDPMVRNSVVAHLSSLSFEELRAMSIPELQQMLTKVVNDDFAAKSMAKPFADVLVSKLIVQ